ncbi:hypothetical protein ACFE04_030663 [Oxalis oulophora]
MEEQGDDQKYPIATLHLHPDMTAQDFIGFLDCMRRGLSMRGTIHEGSGIPILPSVPSRTCPDEHKFTCANLICHGQILRIPCFNSDAYLMGLVFGNVVVRFKKSRFRTELMGIDNHAEIDWIELIKEFDFEPSYSEIRKNIPDDQVEDCKTFSFSYTRDAVVNLFRLLPITVPITREQLEVICFNFYRLIMFTGEMSRLCVLQNEVCKTPFCFDRKIKEGGGDCLIKSFVNNWTFISYLIQRVPSNEDWIEPFEYLENDGTPGKIENTAQSVNFISLLKRLEPVEKEGKKKKGKKKNNAICVTSDENKGREIAQKIETPVKKTGSEIAKISASSKKDRKKAGKRQRGLMEEGGETRREVWIVVVPDSHNQVCSFNGFPSPVEYHSTKLMELHRTKFCCSVDAFICHWKFIFCCIIFSRSIFPRSMISATYLSYHICFLIISLTNFVHKVEQVAATKRVKNNFEKGINVKKQLEIDLEDQELTPAKVKVDNILSSYCY